MLHSLTEIHSYDRYLTISHHLHLIYHPCIVFYIFVSYKRDNITIRPITLGKQGIIQI